MVAEWMKTGFFVNGALSVIKTSREKGASSVIVASQSPVVKPA
jgi:ribosomal protein L30E